MDGLLTLSNLSLAFEGVVAVLLIAMIYFAVKLNQRIGQMRDRETQMQQLIDGLNEAVGRAEASVGNLKNAGANAEAALSGCIERAQALRDDLMFMIDRGDRVADKIENSSVDRATPNQASSLDFRAPATKATDDGGSHPIDESLELEGSPSRAERELVRAIRSSRGER